ncbi:MAG: hypothetical protein HY770_07750 [Chitinivibrionia bacterium]|nr:hypothetical protein [Chitinivibrionia bacterium]
MGVPQMFGQRPAGIFISACVAFVAFNPLHVFSATVVKEAETFNNCYDVANDVIQVSPYPTCSGGGMMIGLDHYGEWVEYPVTISVEGDYTAHMHCRGDYGLVYWFELTLTPSGGGLVHTYSVSFAGKGFG